MHYALYTIHYTGLLYTDYRCVHYAHTPTLPHYTPALLHSHRLQRRSSLGGLLLAGPSSARVPRQLPPLLPTPHRRRSSSRFRHLRLLLLLCCGV
jgi:hypothetical protein